jgi:capsular polysaccharide export protein
MAPHDIVPPIRQVVHVSLQWLNGALETVGGNKIMTGLNGPDPQLSSAQSLLFRESPEVKLEASAFVFGFSPWKEHLDTWLPERRVHRAERTLGKLEFYTRWAPRLLWSPDSRVYVWGYKHPEFLEQFCRKYGIPLIRVEDGFLRSVGLGSTKAPPISLCFDSPVLYYDATAVSQLERLIETYPFDSDPGLLARARAGMELVLQTRLSKYNSAQAVDIAQIYGPKRGRRVLVLGQVEGDMSILKGCANPIAPHDLVRMAASENPGAQIIYKPHPETLSGPRAAGAIPQDVRDAALVLEQNIALADSFETIDQVYTITSLSGFEALLRGIKVTCLGMPFYAGWGPTEDRQACPRRRARRGVVEIFAAAYLLYPRYYDPRLKKKITFEEAVSLLHREKSLPA